MSLIQLNILRMLIRFDCDKEHFNHYVKKVTRNAGDSPDVFFTDISALSKLLLQSSIFWPVDKQMVLIDINWLTMEIGFL